ncbi:hypothetical protein ABTA28_19315, partial [Acinetobacter baumannii]
KKDVGTLRSKFLSIDYPGNRTIPESAEEHYLFAGEPGRRYTFARHLLRRGDKDLRQTAEAFDEYLEDYSAGERQSITIKRTSAAEGATDD